MRIILIGGLAATAILTAGCTTRGDVWNARQSVREARAYGDAQDVRDAKHDLRVTRRAYQDEHQCGPRYGRPC